MNRVVHFDINADLPERAAKFYKEVFGWKFEKWDDPSHKIEYWMITTGTKEPGINGGLSKRMEPKGKGTNSFVCTIDVDSVDKYMEKVKIHGGSLMGEKMEIMGVGWMAMCYDTEGNLFGIMEMNKKAK